MLLSKINDPVQKTALHLQFSEEQKIKVLFRLGQGFWEPWRCLGKNSSVYSIL